VEVHRRISSPALPALRDMAHDEETGQVHLVFDYGGEPMTKAIADSLMQSEGAPSTSDLAAHTTATLLTALRLLHASGRSYNKLKPGQLLWDASRAAKDFPVKLVDFGAGETLWGCC
jgi:serine/threonine protein kinase